MVGKTLFTQPSKFLLAVFLILCQITMEITLYTIVTMGIWLAQEEEHSQKDFRKLQSLIVHNQQPVRPLLLMWKMGGVAFCYLVCEAEILISILINYFWPILILGKFSFHHSFFLWMLWTSSSKNRGGSSKQDTISLTFYLSSVKENNIRINTPRFLHCSCIVLVYQDLC